MDFKIGPEHAGLRLDTFLASQIDGWSRARLQKLIENEDVLVNGKPSKPSYKLREGDDLEIELTATSTVEFAPEWSRVLLPDGDLWIVIGDRHDGQEWAGVDGLLTAQLRRAGFGLQAKGCWAQTRSREPWYDRINYVLRFRKAGRRAPPSRTTLCWMLPLPRSHRASLWDATPAPVIRCAIEESRRRGTVLDPFAGSGTVGLIATAMGRAWVGVEKDPRMAALAARRLRLRRVRRS